MIKKIAKRILSLNFLLPFKKGQRFIFIYHDVSTPASPQYSKHYSTTPQVFGKHLDFFKRHFKMVSLDEIVSTELDANYNYASVVFDDGFMSVKENAAPILQDKNIPFAVFLNKMAIEQNRLWLSDLELGVNDYSIVSDEEFECKGIDTIIENLKTDAAFNESIATKNFEHAKGIRIYMNEQDVLGISKSGVTIGSHTVSHPVLSMCSEAVQESEIAGNKSYLDNLLNQNTIHFAFPFGKKEHFNTNTIEVLKRVGHHFFYTSNPDGFSKKDLENGLISRIGVINDTCSELMFYINRTFLKKIDL